MKYFFILLGLFLTVMWFPSRIEYRAIEKVYAEEIVKLPPVLQRICKAESNCKQFNKDGTVLVGKLTPDDKGAFQISEKYWGKKAKELGYDIYTKVGNYKMALWIFEHHGSEPWFPSKHKWK